MDENRSDIVDSNAIIPLEAGLPAVRKRRRRLTAAQGLDVLDYLLQKSFPPKRINKILQDLSEADDIRMTKEGLQIRTPNWSARTEGLKQVLNLKGFTSSKDGEAINQPITKITFNVVNNVQVNNQIEKKDNDAPKPEE